jgi:membrane protein
MEKIKQYFTLLKDAFKEFDDDNGFKLSASLSYSTVFAMAPMLIIIISLAGIFLGRDAIEGRVYEQIKGLAGDSAALQIQEIIKNLQQSQHGVKGVIIGSVVLIIGATGVFTEIQSSINYIWSVRAKPKKGILKFLMNRVISFSLIISMGFILLVSLIANSLMDILSDQLKLYFKDFTVYLFYALNIILIFGIISVLFAVIFKILPDATIRWKDAFVGSFFTSFMFLLGKFLIGLYLGNSNIGITYGAAASIVVILTWVYYSSIILYYGAEFTKLYAVKHGHGIKHNDTAVFIIKREAKEIDVTGYVD